MKFINKKFWEDYEFIKKALSVNCNSIDFLTDKIYFLHEDEFHKIWLNTKKRNYDAICQKDESFIDNIVPVLDVLSETGNGKLLGNVSERLRNDEKIVCAALQSSIIPIDLKHWDYDYDLETLEYIGNDLWCNSQFVLKVLKMFAPVEYEILERFNEKIPKDVRALYFKD